jgi:hypothetical protein
MTDTQHAEIVGLLTDIRSALAFLCQPVEDVSEDGQPSCEHPESARTDFSTPREVQWVCGACGHVERRMTGASAVSPAAADGE